MIGWFRRTARAHARIGELTLSRGQRRARVAREILIQTLLAGSLLFLVVAFGATLAPARWAARIPPTEAMKME